MVAPKKKKLSIKFIAKDLLGSIWSIYFYLLGFYILSRFLSLSIKSWQNCNWRAFDILIVICSILSLYHPRVQKFLRSFKNELNLKKIISDAKLARPTFSKINIRMNPIEKIQIILLRGKSLLIFLFKTLKKAVYLSGAYALKPFKFFIVKIKAVKWTKMLILKWIIIFAILGCALSKNMQMIDFWILAYGLIAVLFIIESRIAAGFALICLAACPFLLIFKQEILAEAMAVYAYYFLIITVLIQIRELKKESVDNLFANNKKRIIIKLRN